MQNVNAWRALNGAAYEDLEAARRASVLHLMKVLFPDDDGEKGIPHRVMADLLTRYFPGTPHSCVNLARLELLLDALRDPPAPCPAEDTPEAEEETTTRIVARTREEVDLQAMETGMAVLKEFLAESPDLLFPSVPVERPGEYFDPEADDPQPYDLIMKSGGNGPTYWIREVTSRHAGDLVAVLEASHTLDISVGAASEGTELTPLEGMVLRSVSQYGYPELEAYLFDGDRLIAHLDRDPVSRRWVQWW